MAASRFLVPIVKQNPPTIVLRQRSGATVAISRLVNAYRRYDHVSSGRAQAQCGILLISSKILIAFGRLSAFERRAVDESPRSFERVQNIAIALAGYCFIRLYSVGVTPTLPRKTWLKYFSFSKPTIVAIS